MSLQSQQEPENETETAWMRWRRTLFSTPGQDNVSTAPSSTMQAEEDKADLLLHALREALDRRAQATPGFLRNTGIFANLGFGVGWLIANTHFGFVAFWLLLFSGLNPMKSLPRHNKELDEATDALRGTQDLRTIGPLSEVLPCSAHAALIARSILSRLLPRLTPADIDLLNERQITCLRQAFKRHTDHRLFWREDPIFAEILHNALTTLGVLPPVNLPLDDGLPEPQTAEVEALLEPFQQAVRQRRKNTNIATVAAGMSAGFAILNLCIATRGGAGQPLLFVAIGSLGITFALASRGLLRLKRLMDGLAKVRDLRIAGPLIEIAAVEEGSAKVMARRILISLLPRFHASDAKGLTDNQHVALLRALTRGDATRDFCISALKALEQVGDARALPVVESIAMGKRGAADARVQAAAQDCLPYLQIRCEQQRASQTLLRASAPGGMPADTLLRPAQGGGAAEPTELLRAGSSPPESD